MCACCGVVQLVSGTSVQSCALTKFVYYNIQNAHVSWHRTERYAAHLLQWSMAMLPRHWAHPTMPGRQEPRATSAASRGVQAYRHTQRPSSAPSRGEAAPRVAAGWAVSSALGARGASRVGMIIWGLRRGQSIFPRSGCVLHRDATRRGQQSGRGPPLEHGGHRQSRDVVGTKVWKKAILATRARPPLP